MGKKIILIWKPDVYRFQNWKYHFHTMFRSWVMNVQSWRNRKKIADFRKNGNGFANRPLLGFILLEYGGFLLLFPIITIEAVCQGCLLKKSLHWLAFWLLTNWTILHWFWKHLVCYRWQEVSMKYGFLPCVPKIATLRCNVNNFAINIKSIKRL